MGFIKVLCWLAGFAMFAGGLWAAFKAMWDPMKEELHVGRGVVPAVVGLTALIVCVTVSGGFGEVPAGYRGVVTQFGAVTGEVKLPGLYVVNPFTNRVELMDVQVHAYKASAAAASKDMQNVSAEITLNFQLSPDKVVWMYNNMRRDYGERVIVPSVQEAVKSVTANYEAEKLITNRPLVRDGIEDILSTRLAHFGITMDQMSITNFSFSEDFANAIEAKVVATQLAQKAENEVRKAKFEADAAIATARGTAEAIRIQAEAIQHQGGAAYVQLKAIERWNGTVPQWVGGGQPIPFVNVTKPQ